MYVYYTFHKKKYQVFCYYHCNYYKNIPLDTRRNSPLQTESTSQILFWEQHCCCLKMLFILHLHSH